MDRESRKVIHKLRKPLYKIIFSRFFFIMLLFVLQIFFLLWIFIRINEFYSNYIVIYKLLGLCVVILIVNTRTNPTYKLSWALLVAFLPVMGTLLYIHANTNWSRIFSKRMLMETITEMAPFTRTSKQVKRLMAFQSRELQKVSRYLEEYNFPTFSNSDMTYYATIDKIYIDMVEAIDRAEKFIFLEFFIIEEGFFWDGILEALIKKHREGVDVRIMYDDMGCLATLPRYYHKKLERMGLKAKVFSRVKPLISLSYNNRDHRKILVIDGKQVFSGGFNIADEYLNLVKRFGHWKDMGFKLEGEAVKSYTLMFLQMWNATEEKSDRDNYLDYLNVDYPKNAGKEGFVIPYSDGPHRTANIAENVYLDVINGADQHVWIMTPYLIPDNELLHALKHAAKSGVDVRIILPGIPDKKIINILTKSYCPELLRNGVKIYEYTPGFVHSKLMEADNKIAVAGTINLDFRSLDLHYECATLVAGKKVVADIYQDFLNTFTHCREFTEEDYKKLGFFHGVTAMILRLFAPIL